MKPVVRSDFARLAFPFQEKTNTTRHPGLSVPGFEISVPGFEISIPGFENPIAGFEISKAGFGFSIAGFERAGCRVVREKGGEVSRRPRNARGQRPRRRARC